MSDAFDFDLGFFSNYELTRDEIERQIPTRYFSTPRSLGVNESGRMKVAVIANFPRRPAVLDVPRHAAFRLVQEPTLDGLFYSFTRRKRDPYFFLEKLPHHPWHVSLSYEELKNLRPPEKQFGVSVISSTKRDLPMHKLRDDLATRLEELVTREVHVFGRGRKRYVQNKEDALLPYRYSVVIENARQPGFFTEKIMDAFLSWTVPVYFGCPDIESFFPPHSMVQINADDVPSAVRQILKLNEVGIEDRLDALEEARTLVLEKYSLGAYLGSKLKASENTFLGVKTKKHLALETSTMSHWLRDKLNELL